MFIVTSIILTTLTTIILAQSDNHDVCMTCSVNGDCIDGNGVLGDVGGALEECRDFGDDFGKLCYWKNENNADAGTDVSRVCASDFECSLQFSSISLAGLLFGGGESGVYSCLRCCNNKINNNNFCTATIGSGREPCGVIGEHGAGISGSTAPCCEEEICLDNVAGICGVEVTAPCGDCIVWNYILGDGVFSADQKGLQYISEDNCGEGLICLPNSDKPNLYKPGSDMGGDIVYNEGVCIPNSEDGTLGNSSCDTDEECNGCMRCCGGQCKRIKGESCGFKKGACCYNDICKDNICKTPTASPTAAPLTASPTAAPLTASPTTAPLTVSPTPAPSHTIILTKPPTKDD
eukprot:916694_1